MKTQPVDILIAVMHKVGPNIRIKDDAELAKIFNVAANKHPQLLGRFKCHPQYGDSPLLAETLHIMNMGGSIERFNAASYRYQATDVTTGNEGKVSPSNQRKAIDDIARCRSIEQCNASYYQATEATTGNEGEKVYDAFPPNQRRAIDDIAMHIRNAFESRGPVV